MKKIMMTLAAVAVAATMDAQVYLGGALGFNSNSSNDVTTTSISIMPEIGYKLDDTMAVGIGLGFSDDGVKDANTTTFTIQPYLRYNFVKFDNVSLFCDASIYYVHSNLKNGNLLENKDLGTNTFGIGVTPGIAYTPTEKLTFTAALGKGLYFDSSKTDADGAKSTTNFGLNLNSLSLVFGMYYNF